MQMEQIYTQMCCSWTAESETDEKTTEVTEFTQSIHEKHQTASC